MHWCEHIQLDKKSWCLYVASGHLVANFADTTHHFLYVSSSPFCFLFIWGQETFSGLHLCRCAVSWSTPLLSDMRVGVLWHPSWPPQFSPEHYSGRAAAVMSYCCHGFPIVWRGSTVTHSRFMCFMPDVKRMAFWGLFRVHTVQDTFSTSWHTLEIHSLQYAIMSHCFVLFFVTDTDVKSLM